MLLPTVRASLRICGDELMPEEVTKLLGCTPSRSHRKGDTITSKKFIHSAPTGVWLLNSHREGGVGRIVNGLLDSVTGDPQVWQMLSKNFRVECFVGVFATSINSGFSISADTLKRLGDLGIALALDLYCSSGEMAGES
jgi:hypothetical protein